MSKPIVVYIEDDGSTSFIEHNPSRDALRYVLKEFCSCEVMQYRADWVFNEDLPNVKRHLDAIILFIIKQNKYDHEEHEAIIEVIRKKISQNLPIVVIPEWGEKEFKRNPDDTTVYVFRHTDVELIELVNRLKGEWKATCNIWLGPDGKDTDCAMLIEQLEHAYQVHYLDDDNDGMFGSPDHNHMVVAEALRTKLLPVEFLKSEFDDTLESRPLPEAVESSIYFEEVSKLRSMNEIEQKSFKDSLSRAQGYEPLPSGAYLKKSASRGNSVSGFAIETKTLETFITSRHGMHDLAGQNLMARIGEIERTLRNPDFNEEDERFLITGYILKEIDGFKTPILQLFPSEDGEYPDLKRVGTFLHKEQKFIPVDNMGKIIEG